MHDTLILVTDIRTVSWLNTFEKWQQKKLVKCQYFSLFSALIQWLEIYTYLNRFSSCSNHTRIELLSFFPYCQTIHSCLVFKIKNESARESHLALFCTVPPPIPLFPILGSLLSCRSYRGLCPSGSLVMLGDPPYFRTVLCSNRQMWLWGAGSQVL